MKRNWNVSLNHVLPSDGTLGILKIGPLNHCHTQLNVCEKEELQCFLYLIQIFVLKISWRIFIYNKISINVINIMKIPSIEISSINESNWWIHLFPSNKNTMLRMLLLYACIVYAGPTLPLFFLVGVAIVITRESDVFELPF